MPRYFFDVVDHGRENDEEGMDLPDNAAARVAAITYAGSVIHNEPDLLDGATPLRIEVTDDSGKPVCKIITSVIDEG